MKKVLVIMMILLAVTASAVFAKEGFTLRGGFSYDFINSKIPDNVGILEKDAYWRAHAFGAEFGVTYNFSDSFLVYGDTTIGFYNTFKVGDHEAKKDEGEKALYLGTANHVGAAYDFDFDSALDLQVGGGLAMEFARVTETEKIDDYTNNTDTIGILSFGFGLYANVGYSLSDRVSITATLHPDFMIVSSIVVQDTTTTTFADSKAVFQDTDTWMLFDTAFSFKFNASVGVTFKF